MASHALILAANTAAQPYQPTPYQEHSSTFHQQIPSYQPQASPASLSKGKKRRNTPSGGLKKGLDTLSKCLERRIDQQILQVQSGPYDTSSQPVVAVNSGDKKVYWEEHGHVVQRKA